MIKIEVGLDDGEFRKTKEEHIIKGKVSFNEI